ncbi:LacI family DNA-binding transcriptional regulator [Paenibacillus hexagrammi]|uniref:LacI family transcriptional regulator n=1 Tax=Paenibacillus hexagrammi TaxID=2908839 RepID=A0ABY3SMW1_9BACL|nr:LacI family DNA-binding transcriptional regulator [Paenibacillus sp. YPD9-1]UJF34426.1 LacI family transcriptional regulator [Paenibacillus sp. YPD9-1]
MKVTINDIAKAAGVAKSTVSKVLNDAPSISLATKRRVRQVMSDMNYTPSSIATQLARKSSFNIGLLVDMSRRDDFLNQFFYNIIGGVESVIGPQGYELTLCNMNNHDHELLMNRFVLNKRVDGFILDTSLLTPQLAESFNQVQFPFLAIGELPGYSEMSWVDIDNHKGAELLTEHLIFQGYRRIAFLGGESGEPIWSNRISGYKKALLNHSMSVVDSYMQPGYSNVETGCKLMQDLLELPPRPMPLYA